MATHYKVRNNDTGAEEIVYANSRGHALLHTARVNSTYEVSVAKKTDLIAILGTGQKMLNATVLTPQEAEEVADIVLPIYPPAPVGTKEDLADAFF
jgi:hypothetical protein